MSISMPTMIAWLKPRASRAIRARRAMLMIAVITVATAACRGDDPRSLGADPAPADTAPNSSEIRLTSTLSGFANCDDLLEHLRTAAAKRVGPYGFMSPDWYLMDDATEPDALADAQDEAESAASSPQAAAATGPAMLAGVNFSGTNVAEIGVEEADMIKTDGKRVLVLADQQLVVIDAQQRSITGTLDLRDKAWADYGIEMFLNGDDLLIVSQTSRRNDKNWAQLFPKNTSYNIYLTLISRVKITDSDPVLVSGIVVEGSYVNARSINGVARIILRSQPHRLGFVYPSDPSDDRRVDAATQTNRESVMNSELSDWLPHFVSFDSDGSTNQEELLTTCEQVHAPTEFAGFGVVSVLSIPIDGAIDTGTTTAVLAPGKKIYASPESIFVTTQSWIDTAAFEEDPEALRQALDNYRTSIHRFELSADSAAYTASGSIPGYLHNQFSMSEYDGHLRVVTTTGRPWEGSSETFLRILREDDGDLVEVGSVGNMGKGEAVQSVRLVGDVGYVVTFEQIDPFYTLDLSDHTNPLVVGELKIPGFSSYLHPIGNGRVLGVGSTATEQGQVTGSKVSLFDVNDPADPREVAVWALPDGRSDIGWDHRAFNWWEPEQIAIIPAQDRPWAGAVMPWAGAVMPWAGAVILRVDGSELIEVGRIDHDNSILINTDCDHITEEQLRNLGSQTGIDLYQSFADDGVGVLICDSEDLSQLANKDCSERNDLIQMIGIVEIIETMGASFDDKHIVICWGGVHSRDPLWAIGRTMVIDRDELWSISGRRGPSALAPARIQVNDLTSLARLDVIEIG